MLAWQGSALNLVVLRDFNVVLTLLWPWDKEMFGPELCAGIWLYALTFPIRQRLEVPATKTHASMRANRSFAVQMARTVLFCI